MVKSTRSGKGMMASGSPDGKLVRMAADLGAGGQRRTRYGDERIGNGRQGRGRRRLPGKQRRPAKSGARYSEGAVGSRGPASTTRAGENAHQSRSARSVTIAAGSMRGAGVYPTSPFILTSQLIPGAHPGSLSRFVMRAS